MQYRGKCVFLIIKASNKVGTFFLQQMFLTRFDLPAKKGLNKLELLKRPRKILKSIKGKKSKLLL